MQSVLRLGRERRRLATSGPLFIYLMKSSFSPGLGLNRRKKLFWWEGSQEPSQLQSTEVEASESREATRDEKSLSHQDSLQPKPLFRNRDCAHETRQEQLLPLVFRRETVFS